MFRRRSRAAFQDEVGVLELCGLRNAVLASALNLIGGILIRKKAKNWLEYGHITKRCIRAIRPIRMDCSGWSASKRILALSVCATRSSGNWALESQPVPNLRAERRDERNQQPKLTPQEIDKNAYRRPAVRERCPRDMPKRRAPGWAAVNFVLPRKTILGLALLTKSMANGEQAERSRGHQLRAIPASRQPDYAEHLLVG